MKRLLVGMTLAAAALAASATDVGVSVSIGQPGFYGRIDIGDFPAPQVIYAEPIVIQRVPVVTPAPPIYLRVPPGHAKHWRKHCGKYNACGQPVYFVRDDWYNRVYAPRVRGHGDRRGDDGDRRGRGRDKEHRGRGHDRD